ncbi:dephospho-CoA kinase, partial [Blyttiomyces helicus]
MLLIGLTGGISTGKSTVSSHLKKHLPELAIVDADLIARQVVEPSTPALARLRSTFGPEILNPDGSLNRARLGEIVFADSHARRRLNAITHPEIREEMLRRVLGCFLTRERVCVLDTPLLIESGLTKFVHLVVVVFCPEDVQKQRLILRDGFTPDQAQARIDSQMPIAKKRDLANEVIDNSGDLNETHRQVDDLL